jgi:hypothetical protein
MASSVRYDPANYRGVYASLAQNTTRFAADSAQAPRNFFKGKAQASRSPHMCGQTVLVPALLERHSDLQLMSGGEMLIHNPGRCARYLRPYWNWMDVPSFKLIRNTYSVFG